MATPFVRVDYPCQGLRANAGILPRYPADLAAWVWHPHRLNETAFLRFTLEVNCEHEEMIEIQVSADQRFQLFLDGQTFAIGPDRSDIAHWSLQTYRGRMSQGHHIFTAVVWWIADSAYGVPNVESFVTPPMAQASFRGGFLFATCGEATGRFNTGTAPWKVEDLTHAVSLAKIPFPSYHDIGPSFEISAAAWNEPGPAIAPVVAREAMILGNPTGVARPGWRCEPSPLPEQERRRFQGGKIREIRAGEGALDSWQDLVSKQTPLTVRPHHHVTVLWDVEDYLCGYPLLQTQGGKGAAISIEWAEALYENPDRSKPIEATTSKGHRDQTLEKQFFGFGDRFLCSDSGRFLFPTFWWRSGRYLQIRVETQKDPLIIEKLSIETTRYPLECESRFETDDTDLERIASLAVNTMRQGTHDLFTDSPYYEQMAYVGDNVTEALVCYVLTKDTRITRRAIELFDWSRSVTGLIAERWPSACYQGSATYAMLWPSMVRNHAFWRDEPDFIRKCLRGIRQLVEELLVYRRADGLLGQLPGWSFVDWVPEWPEGCPPGYKHADSSIIQMHWLLCLQSAAELELHFGDPHLLQRLRGMESVVRQAIIARYYSSEEGLFYDDSERHLSEHANALATLLGLFDVPQTPWPEELVKRPHAKCSVYFSHYLLEAFAKLRSEHFFARMDLWRSFLDYGLHTIPEQPEPTRSDCHAWGAHPLYHFHASIAGIRPASPGFKTVHIRPMAGNLRFLKGSLPHPNGKIHYDLELLQDELRGKIILPENVSGTLEFSDMSYALESGENPIGNQLRILH